MLQSAAAKYEESRNKTTSKGELLVALYQGMFRFLRGAQVCFEQKQLARGRELTSKAHAIINELQIALDPNAAPELCQRLDALYSFSLERLAVARTAADPSPIAEVISVLTPLKEAWEQAVPEAARQGICNHAE